MIPRRCLSLAVSAMVLAVGITFSALPAQAQEQQPQTALPTVVFTPYTSYADLYAKNDATREIIADFGNTSPRPLIEPKGKVSHPSDTLYMFHFSDDCGSLGCRTVMINTQMAPPVLAMHVYTPGVFSYNATTGSLFVCTEKGHFIEWAADASGEFSPIPFPLDKQRDPCPPYPVEQEP